MIQKGTEAMAPKNLMKGFTEKGWNKSGLSCSIVSTRDKSIV